jgi:hypothetical protein
LLPSEFDFTPHRGLSLVRPGSAMRASGRANVAPNWSVRRLTRTRWRPRSTFPDYRVAINRHRHHNQALMRGQGLVSNGPTPEGLWRYDPDLKALAEAGHPEASPRLNSTRNRPGCRPGPENPGSHSNRRAFAEPVIRDLSAQEHRPSLNNFNEGITVRSTEAVYRQLRAVSQGQHAMGLIILLVVLILLFDGGGFYYGPP